VKVYMCVCLFMRAYRCVSFMRVDRCISFMRVHICVSVMCVYICVCVYGCFIHSRVCIFVFIHAYVYLCVGCS
jgi:hypothetical protein